MKKTYLTPDTQQTNPAFAILSASTISGIGSDFQDYELTVGAEE